MTYIVTAVIPNEEDSLKIQKLLGEMKETEIVSWRKKL